MHGSFHLRLAILVPSSVALAASLCFAGTAGPVSAAPSAFTAVPAAPAGPTGLAGQVPLTPPGEVRPACATASTTGLATCMTITRVRAPGGFGIRPANNPPAGYGPADLLSAYNLAAAAATAGGQTIAVVDPFDDPNAESDLAVYRAQYGLPPCTTAGGCFGKVNENGTASPLPSANASWATEESLDLDLISAICPNCRIALVEAKSPSPADLAIAEDTAAGPVGAKFVTNGWGGYNSLTANTTYGPSFDHPGVAITAPAGDGGYPLFGRATFPASSQFVTAVGGTQLVRAAGTARGWTESAWSLTGSGCGASGKPGWQADTGCVMRTANDVAAVADPSPGLAYYDSYSSGGWGAGGGTGAAAAIIAAVYALAGTPAPYTYPASYPYLDTGALNDITAGVTSGCNPVTYLCAAGPGYDGPTGSGTPNGTAAFTLGTLTSDIVTVVGQMPQLSAVGEPITAIQLTALDTDPGQVLTYSATGLPDGLAIDPSTGQISGTPTMVGTFQAAVTATDGTGSRATVRFPWYTHDVISISWPPSLGSYTTGSAVNVQLHSTDSAAAEPLTYSAQNPPPGLTVSPSGLVSGVLTKTGYGTINVTVADPTGASVTAGIYWNVHGLIHLTSPGDQSAVAGATVTFPVRFTDTGAESVFINLNNGPPGAWPYQSGLVAGWPVVAGVYRPLLDVADGFGGEDSTTFTWTVSPAPDAGPVGPVRSAASGGCLDDTGNSAADGTLITVRPCDGLPAQAWTLVQDGTLRSHGQCLSTQAAVATFVLQPCQNPAVVHWQIGQDGQFLNADPGGNGCLRGPGTARGVPDLAACGASSREEWIAPAGPIRANVPGKCLDNAGGRLVNGNKIQIWTCGAGRAQQWTMEPDGTIRTAGRCLDVARATAGTPLRLWACTGAAGEQWRALELSYLGGGELTNPASGLCVADPRASAASGTAVTLGACMVDGFTVYGTVWRVQ